MTNRRTGIYERVLRPWFFRMDPEEAHLLAHKLAPGLSILRAQTEIWRSQLSPRLATTLAGTRLENPVGLAAGFDKNGDLVQWLRLMGFGFAEIGSVTGLPSPGNARPRVFRLPEDEAVINYMGLNGEGASSVASKLAKSAASLPLAINIAKTNNPAIVGDRAIEDFVSSFRAVKEIQSIFISINVSCPNTHESKLAEVETIDTVLHEINSVNQKKHPLFLKLSPDSDSEMIEKVVEMALRHGLAGFVCGNTSLDRSTLKTPASEVEKVGPGGLSGPPIRERALALCRNVARLKARHQQIIACGGIDSGEAAFQFFKAGASAIEIYTGLVYHGPFLPFAICRELGNILEQKKVDLDELAGESEETLALL